MARKRKTWYAILGLLMWKPMSGYDLKKMVEMALSHFWSESYGNLFPTLGALVDAGLASRREDTTSGRRRHVYTITVKGRRAFERWLAEPTDPPQTRNEFLLKFFLSSRRSLDESIALLEVYRAQQRERLAEYKESEAVLESAARSRQMPESLASVFGTRRPGRGGENELLLIYLTLRHGVHAVEARLAWIDEALRALRARKQRQRKERT